MKPFFIFIVFTAFVARAQTNEFPSIFRLTKPTTNQVAKPTIDSPGLATIRSNIFWLENARHLCVSNMTFLDSKQRQRARLKLPRDGELETRLRGLNSELATVDASLKTQRQREFLLKDQLEKSNAKAASNN